MVRKRGQKGRTRMKMNKIHSHLLQGRVEATVHQTGTMWGKGTRVPIIMEIIIMVTN